MCSESIWEEQDLCYSWIAESTAEREIENRSDISMGRLKLKSRKDCEKHINLNNLRVRKWRSQQCMKNCVFHKLICFNDTYSKDYA